MFTNHIARRLQRLVLVAVAAIGLGIAALPPTPASAHVVVSVGVPVYRPYSKPYYHRAHWRPHYYPAYYHRPYWRPYWRPYYPRVAYRACGFGWHLVPGHWNRWGRWVPARCRPNW